MGAGPKLARPRPLTIFQFGPWPALGPRGRGRAGAGPGPGPGPFEALLITRFVLTGVINIGTLELAN